MIALFRKRKDGLQDKHILYKPVDITQLDQAAISRSFARLFSTDDGRTVLSYLQSQTLDRALTARRMNKSATAKASEP